MITKEQAMKVLGYNCKRLRKLKRLTQEDMQEFKIPYRGYQNIEGGRTNVTLQTLVRLADAFGVEIIELLRNNRNDESFNSILGSNKKGLNAF